MRLTSVNISGFRSYRAIQELHLNQHITILAGRNNVGKTALLKAIRLPVELQAGERTGFSTEHIWEYSYDELVAVIPDFATALKANGISQPRLFYRFRTRLARDTPEGPIRIVNPVSPMSRSGLAINEANISDTPFRVQLTRDRANDPDGYRFWFGDLDIPDDEFWRRFLQSWVNLINTSIGNTYYVNPHRVGYRPMQFNPTTELAPDGSNLTTVVATLATNERRSRFAALEAFMRTAFPEISYIDAQMTDAPAMATLHIVFGDSSNELSVPIEQCGTGIEQMLMLSAAILTAASPRLFLIDEPHAFLHPAAERSLFKLIRDHGEHQYVVATHSAVFLNAVPLKQVRLITIDGTGSHINDVRHVTDILTAVGVTAADLWSADALLWIEGSSDVKAVEQLIALMPELDDVFIRVLAMPDWMRSLSASEKNAQATVRFCESVRAAITPFKIPSLFVFDADEKKEALKARIEAATADQGRFLPVRELENLFLVPEAVHRVLANLCNQVDKTAPTVQEVAQEIEQLLSQTDDRHLYRTEMSGPDRTKVVGSEVLERLWWRWATTSYDKVTYSPELVTAVNDYNPSQLEPFRLLLHELAQLVRIHRTET